MTSPKFRTGIIQHMHNFGTGMMRVAEILAKAEEENTLADIRFLEIFLPICELDAIAFWDVSDQITQLIPPAITPKVAGAPRVLRYIWAAGKKHPNFLYGVAKQNGIATSSLGVLSIEQVLGRIELNLNPSTD